jgi:hypothetical protein
VTAPFKTPTAACRHTLYHLERNGSGAYAGTWWKYTDRRGDYVACSLCGKFYGRF